MRASGLRAKWPVTVFVCSMTVAGCAAQTPAASGPAATPAAGQPATAPPTRPAATAPASATQPASAPATQATLDPEVDKILTRLEEREVQDLQARLTWRLQYVIDPDATVKSGELWYQKAEPVGKFLIRFQQVISGNRKDKVDERHMFDGCWYVELQSQTKTYQRREIRRPGDPWNPYKVGEGIFPMPFGQKKADLLREFAVERIEPGKDDPPATDRLRLTPHAGTRSGESYKELDLWIGREGPAAGAPIKVQVAKKDGTGKVNSTITITFEAVKLNQGFSSGVFEIKKPPGYEELPEERLGPAAPPAETGGKGP